MDEKKMVYIIIGLLVVGCAGVLFIVFPWMMGRGVSNWQEWLINDSIVFITAFVFGYGVYIGIRSQNKK